MSKKEGIGRGCPGVRNPLKRNDTSFKFGNLNTAYVDGHSGEPRKFLKYRMAVSPVSDVSGKLLTENDDVVVHHRDGDRSNNNWSNLMLMTRAEHSRLHWQGTFGEARRAALRMRWDEYRALMEAECINA